MGVIKYLYRKTFLRKYLKPFKFIYDFFLYRIIPEKVFINMTYKEVFGSYPNLKNPKTLNEKMQWLKLYDRTALHTKCADKFLSREHIKKSIGKQYLVPLVFKTKDISKIVSENLPDYPSVVKTTHGQGVVHIIKDKFNIDYELIHQDLRKSLRENYYYKSKEWQYKNIIPRIIVEKLLICKNGKMPNDYKFHCFNGRVHIVYVSVDREGLNKRNIYDRDWNPLLFTWAKKFKDTSNIRGEEIDPPDNYEEMLIIAEKLSQDFRYVRIDLFNVDGNIFCGEITFHHGSGLDVFNPPEWDRKLGDILNL